MASRDSRGRGRRRPTHDSFSAQFKSKRSSKGGAASRAVLREVLEQAVLGGYDYVIGLDPDSKNVGLCGWDVREEHNPDWVSSTHVERKHKGQQSAPAIFRECSTALGSAASLRCIIRPLIFVEGQRIRRGQGAETKNAQSIVDLAFNAGAALGAALNVWPDCHVVVIEPQMWKGSMDKLIHHSRLLTQLGWTYEKLTEYCRPIKGPLHDGIRNKTVTERLGVVNPGDWKHVMDGLGIAKWGRDQLLQVRARLDREARR